MVFRPILVVALFASCLVTLASASCFDESACAPAAVPAKREPSSRIHVSLKSKLISTNLLKTPLNVEQSDPKKMRKEKQTLLSFVLVLPTHLYSIYKTCWPANVRVTTKTHALQTRAIQRLAASTLPFHVKTTIRVRLTLSATPRIPSAALKVLASESAKIRGTSTPLSPLLSSRPA